MPKPKPADLDLGPMPGKERRAITEQHLADHYVNPRQLFADGWDDAIVGLATQFTNPPLVVYDLGAILDTLQQRDGMTYAEAREYADYNITGAWVGDGTPLFLERVDRL